MSRPFTDRYRELQTSRGPSEFRVGPVRPSRGMRSYRSVGAEAGVGPSDQAIASVTAAPEDVKRWATALLSVRSDDPSAPSGESAAAWADRKHEEGARILAVLASGKIESGYPKIVGGGADRVFVWSSSGARTPPYQPGRLEILDWKLRDNWIAVLGSYEVEIVSNLATGGLAIFDPIGATAGAPVDKVNPVDVKYAAEKDAEAARRIVEKAREALPLGKIATYAPVAIGAALSGAIRIGFPFVPGPIAIVPAVIGTGLTIRAALAEVFRRKSR